MIIKRIINATQKYLLKDTKYFLYYCLNNFRKDYKLNCSFYSEEEFMQKIYAGKSFIRLGDGEIGLIHFLKIHYQKYSDEIRWDFIKIIREYSDNSPYIILIPLFVNYTNKALVSINKLQCWMPLKVTYQLWFNKNAKYFDAHIFYKKDKFKKLLLSYLLKKKVIIVTNRDNIKDIQKYGTLSRIKSRYIESPRTDAYESRHRIRQNIIDTINQSGFKKEEFVILFCAGLSKTLIYELSLDNYQILDVGRGFEGFIKRQDLECLI